MRAFEKYRPKYLTDTAYGLLQQELLADPRKGNTIRGTGGLRKIRWVDKKRGKGKRSGTRIIYYFYVKGDQFWMFLIYDKDEMTDLTESQKKALRLALRNEIQARNLL